MEITRREALGAIGAAAAACCGCAGGRPGIPAVQGPVDVGVADGYSSEGIYPRFRDSNGFYLVRAGQRVYAQSAVCTHEACLISQVSSGFRCRCHGSTFTFDGHVTKGPAQRDLPRFGIRLDGSGHLIVDTRQVFQPSQFDASGAFVDL
jgi:Rieske Fe-S protein